MIDASRRGSMRAARVAQEQARGPDRVIRPPRRVHRRPAYRAAPEESPHSLTRAAPTSLVTRKPCGQASPKREASSTLAGCGAHLNASEFELCAQLGHELTDDVRRVAPESCEVTRFGRQDAVDVAEVSSH